MVGTAPQPKSQTLLFGKVGAHFPGDDPTEGPFVLCFFCFLFAFLLFFLLFCCVFVVAFCFFIAFLLFFFCFLLQFFAISFQKVSSFGGPQFGSGTFPFGWSPVHLAGVSLNIGRSSSASRVHLGPPFSSLMFPLSSAQVLLPCPG